MFVFATLTFVGCKDACEDVTCFNSGTCDGGDCTCVGLFEGTSCDEACIDKFDGVWNLTASAPGFNPTTLTTGFTDLSDNSVRPTDAAFSYLLIEMNGCNDLTASVPNPNPGIIVQESTAAFSGDETIIVNLDYTDSGQLIELTMTFTK